MTFEGQFKDNLLFKKQYKYDIENNLINDKNSSVSNIGVEVFY